MPGLISPLRNPLGPALRGIEAGGGEAPWNGALFDPGWKSANYTLSEGNRVATKTQQMFNAPSIAWATRQLIATAGGGTVAEFTVLVNTGSNEIGGGNRPLVGNDFVWLGGTPDSMSYAADGNVYYDGQLYSQGNINTTYTTGDRVAIAAYNTGPPFWQEYIIFYKNGGTAHQVPGGGDVWPGIAHQGANGYSMKFTNVHAAQYLAAANLQMLAP
jgi:hypothetical protein